ncbi:XRE family transcriptional regulator (plasmid) [Terribacillus saccharophilus]|uniref:XRE family transcriptional regulator n=1 Tax=Terribacillus saccharophilus TaxID=361277 RepID=A0A075LQK4_9BACI|nr:helix-turn-helix transcriptional regulator [Terribacillus goriensis]AIF68406.1 XRE family transcriptional regulator [Terribacillus goriensis]
MKTLGTRLKELRTERGIYQSHLAQYLSVTTRHIQRYEADKTDVSLSTLVALADYFEVSLDYLVGRSENRKC